MSSVLLSILHTVLISFISLSLLVERNKVLNPPRDKVEPFKTRDDARKGLRDVDYSKTTLEHVTRSLSDLLKKKPVEVYAIALDLLRDTRKPLPREFAKGVEDIARYAARSSLLDRQLGPWTPETQVKKDDYDRLVGYHLQCKLRLVGSLTTQELIKNVGSNWIWYNTRCGVCRPIPDSFIIQNEALGVGKCPTAWWVIYWERTVLCIADTPCEKAFENDHVWNHIMETLEKKCPVCYEAAAREFPIFKEKLLGMVIKIVNSVCIHFIDLLVGQKAHRASNRFSWRSSCNICRLPFAEPCLDLLLPFTSNIAFISA